MTEVLVYRTENTFASLLYSNGNITPIHLIYYNIRIFSYNQMMIKTGQHTHTVIHDNNIVYPKVVTKYTPIMRYHPNKWFDCISVVGRICIIPNVCNQLSSSIQYGKHSNRNKKSTLLWSCFSTTVFINHNNSKAII